MSTRFADITGQRFGCLVALGLVHEAGTKRGEPRWLLLCDCGQVTRVRTCNLRNGHTKSCGCQNGRPLPVGESAFNSLLCVYRREARNRGFAFDLSRDQFQRLTKGNCHYCGVEPQRVFARKNQNGVYVYNGVDRVDNAGGYTAGNSVSCCFDCNDMKGTMTEAKFIAQVRRIASHRESQEN